MSAEVSVPQERVMSKIYEIRGVKVMIDRDLSELYGVETRTLKQAVRRNVERFPDDFMFEMTKEEFDLWRSQFVMSKEDLKGLRRAPFCFTEQGVSMLSSVLNSKVAIRVNIEIIRTFTKMREMISTNKDLLEQMDEIRRHVLGQDEKIEIVFDHLRKFLREQQSKGNLGYKN